MPIPCGFQRCCGDHGGNPRADGRPVPIPCGFQRCCGPGEQNPPDTRPRVPIPCGFQRCCGGKFLGDIGGTMRVPIPCGFQRCCGMIVSAVCSWTIQVPIPCGFQRCCGATTAAATSSSPGRRAHSMRVSALLRRRRSIRPATCFSSAHSMRVSALLRRDDAHDAHDEDPPGCPFHAGFSAAAAGLRARLRLPDRLVPIPCGFQRCCGSDRQGQRGGLAELVPIPCGFQRCCGGPRSRPGRWRSTGAHSMRVSALLRP